MTWIVGGVTVFGVGIVLADIRVSWHGTNALHKDCLQKVYPVGNFIVAGFAGSVKIGFCLIEDLKRFLFMPDPTKAWSPKIVALKWWRRARHIFKEVPEEEQKLGSSILMVGVHPNINIGESPWPIGITCAFKSPEFEPKFAEIGQFISIGSGSNIEKYKKILESISINSLLKNKSLGLLRLDGAIKDGFGYGIHSYLKNTLNNYPVQGVSSHLHLSTVRRDNISIYSSSEGRISKEGIVDECKMPKVVKSYKEFVSFCKSINLNSALAIC